jgi:hypothetical protein
MNHFEKVFKKCKFIKEIIIKEYRIDNEVLLIIVQNCPFLTTIELDFNQLISNDVIEKFGQTFIATSITN